MADRNNGGVPPNLENAGNVNVADEFAAAAAAAANLENAGNVNVADEFAAAAAEEEYYYNNNNYQPNQSNNEAPAPRPKTILTMIEDGDVEGVRAYLAAPPVDLQTLKDKEGLVTLVVRFATSMGLQNSKFANYLQILRMLLDAGFDPNELDRVNPRYTALNIACQARGKVGPVINLLLERGAAVNGIRTSIPPIFTCIQHKNDEALNALYTAGVNVNVVRPGDKITPLRDAILGKWYFGVASLLTLGASISAVDIIGDNIFITAVKLQGDETNDKKEIVAALLQEEKLQANFKNKADKTALMIAAQNADIQTLELLLRDQRFLATLNMETSKGTALSLVFQRMLDTPRPSSETMVKLLAAARLLMEKGANINTVEIPTSAGPYPVLHYVIDQGDVAIADLVLKLPRLNPSSINIAGGPHGLTPLAYASAKNNLEMMRLLVEKGADINGVSESGTTPIETAVIHGSLDAVQYLIESDAAISDGLIHLAVLFTSEDTLPIFNRFIDFFVERGLNINAHDAEGMTPLMTAAKKGNHEALKVLLAKGADPTLTKIEGNPLTPTAYDMAKDMSIRLVIAPYLETNEPRFRGFLKDDFERFNLVFDDLVNFVICPFCFLPIAHGGGCMYIFEHSCLRELEQQRAAGYRTLPIIHEKLFQTYKDAKQNITVCHHCNRAGYTWSEGAVQGQELVGHAHIELNTADAFVVPRQAQKRGHNYYDKTGCYNQGGGSHSEKLLRIQVLLNFMCFLNEHFVGRISNLRAHLLAREMFWDAPLYSGKYLLDMEFLPGVPDTKIGDIFPDLKGASVKIIDGKIRADKTFLKLCDHPTELLPLPEGVVNVEESERVYPNIPRYGTNAVDLAPLQEVTDNGENFCYWYYIAELMYEGHNDGRQLYRFRHRQPGRTNIHDHGSESLELKELICAPCLETFLRNQTIDAANADKKIMCFTDTCKGHFHPSELQGIISDEAYQQYKAYYNRFAPVLGGGKRNQETDYPPLIGAPVVVEQDTCPVRFRGGKKRTRRVRKTKKTRKARRLRKTRRTK
jgi:ankyrin repeat protein